MDSACLQACSVTGVYCLWRSPVLQVEQQTRGQQQ